jgi:hypothetical protein
MCEQGRAAEFSQPPRTCIGCGMLGSQCGGVRIQSRSEGRKEQPVFEQ